MHHGRQKEKKSQLPRKCIFFICFFIIQLLCHLCFTEHVTALFTTLDHVVIKIPPRETNHFKGTVKNVITFFIWQRDCDRETRASDQNWGDCSSKQCAIFMLMRRNSISTNLKIHSRLFNWGKNKPLALIWRDWKILISENWYLLFFGHVPWNEFSLR
jgi:hypothetical protein